MDPVENFFENIVDSETKPFFRARLIERLKRERSVQGRTFIQFLNVSFKPALLVSLILIINLLAIFSLENESEDPSTDFAKDFGFFQNLEEDNNWLIR